MGASVRKSSRPGESHRDELLRVFKIGPEDIRANRAGLLGARQRDRLRRGISVNLAATALIPLVFVVFVYFAAARPIAWPRYALIGAVLAAGAAVGWYTVRGLLAAMRAGVVSRPRASITTDSTPARASR
jgi:hypothetical protein